MNSAEREPSGLPDVRDTVVLAICRLPLDFRAGRDSAAALLYRTNYLRHAGEITVADFERCLAKNPGLVDAWQQWVEDNRSTPAWFFRPMGRGEFEVGRMDRQGGTLDRMTFDDRIAACAEYLSHEIRQLGDQVRWTYRPWSAMRQSLASRFGG